MTIRLYPLLMTHFNVEGEFLPYELPVKNGLLDYSALEQFLALLLGLTGETECKYEGKSMLFFGCGGVSSALAFKLALSLRKIGLVEINKEKKEKLLTILKAYYPTLPVIAFERSGPLDFSDFDIFYNGTGLGKFSDLPAALSMLPLMEGDIMPKTGRAIDVNYTPWKTLFLQQMISYGFATLNGYSHMLGSTTLHLSYLSERAIDYSEVKKKALTIQCAEKL